MIKKALSIFIFIIGFLGFSFASENYLYFYGNSCSHCIKVENYFVENEIEKDYSVHKYEIFADQENRELLGRYLSRLNLSRSQIWTPFMIVEEDGKALGYLLWDVDIIAYFSALKNGEKSEFTSLVNDSNITAIDLEEVATTNPVKFLGVMIPAALGDSINPCAFAVMLLLLSTILSKTKSKKKAIASGFLFSFAIFVSYFLIGIGVFRVLDYANVTTWFKRVVGGLGILLGLANLKDFFWYGEGFLMEVPLSWRPTMMKLIKTAVSPLGSFFIGILVSLFLLPCSSGPYVFILTLLKSESIEMSWLAVGYLVLYNLIFILPMLVITFLVGTGQSNIEKLAKLKNKNTRYIHLLTGLLMLILWLYVIGSIYFGRFNLG